MTSWRPASGPHAAASRASLLRRVRQYFDAENVLEVETPALSHAAVSDTQIESFSVADSAVSAGPLFLHTSPEFCMKRLLAAGYPDIYSICRVYRDGEAGRLHQPEFTMIEWYRLGMNLNEIIGDTVQLIEKAMGNTYSPQAPIVFDYYDVIRDVCGIDAVTADIESLAEAVDADDGLRAAIGDEKDDWLDLLLLTRIMPTFPENRLTVLRHYPASQAALARLCPDNDDVADRFEVFLGTVELANGYVELANAAEQKTRISRDNESRRRRGRPVRPIDENLLAALDAGLPECAGVAMGVERLQMLHDKTDDIRDVITFAYDPTHD